MGRVTGRFFLFLLLYAGIGLLASPMLKYFILEWEGSSYRLEGFTAEELSENIREAEEKEMEKDIAIPDLMGILEHIREAKRADVIGGITVPAAGISLPVFNGTTKANLMTGAGTMQPGQKMGEGNYSLAGHHMKDESLLFGPLLKVREGDWIHLTDKEQLYTYETVQTEIIVQTDISVMGETEVPSVTLITCDKTGINTDNRLMVRGELIDVSGIEEENDYVRSYQELAQEKKGSRLKEYLLWIWFLGVGLAAGACLWIFCKLTGGKQEWEADAADGYL